MWMSPSKRSRRSMYCTCVRQGCREDPGPPPHSPRARCGAAPPPPPPPYLHSHGRAVVQLGSVHLGQARSSDRLVVKLLEELVG